MEPLSGLDSAFLAAETPTSRPYVAGVLVLDPPPGGAPADEPAWGPASFDRIRAVIAQRLHRVPRLHQRTVRVPLGLQRPLWVDDPAFDLDAHVRRAALPSPGGQPELDAFVGEAMARPLPADRPLWEMVVVEGLDGGRTAVVARLHHAILDGVSGATAMAAFLDLEPDVPVDMPGDVPVEVPGEVPEDVAGRSTLPSVSSVLRYVAASIARQPEVVLGAFNGSLDAMVALADQSRRLAAEGRTPPPTPFRVPRTSLNGSVTSERVVGTLAVPLADLELVRASCGDVTVNDVILCAVGDAVWQTLAERGEHPAAPLVAMVPVSTRGPAEVADDGVAHVGNALSGMLVPLPVEAPDPFERLQAVAEAARVSKDQERLAGGDLLEGVTRALPPLLVRATMRGIGRFRLFDLLPPPVNLAVSTVVVPDVSLWWAGREVSAIFPLGPVVDGVGLNVTAMTYRGTVYVGLVACPRQVPDIQGLAERLGESFDELVVRAGSGSPPPSSQGSRFTRDRLPG